HRLGSGARRWGWSQTCVLPKYGEVDLLERRRRVDAELVGQPSPRAVISRECVGLSPVGVQRADQQALQSFPQRVVLGRGRQLRQVRTAARVEHRLAAVLEQAESQLVQRGSRAGGV